MTARLRSLRKAVWQQDKTGVGEALLDIHGFCTRLTQCGVVEVTGAVWSEPFSFGVDAKPRIVLHADAREKGAAGAVPLSTLDWSVVVEGNSYRVRIARASTLTVGRTYDLRFLVVF